MTRAIKIDLLPVSLVSILLDSRLSSEMRELELVPQDKATDRQDDVFILSSPGSSRS